MALYRGSLKVCPIVSKWRGFWSVTVKGIPGTVVDCGTQKTIGESGFVSFRFAEAGEYTIISEFGGDVETKSITLVDGTYFITLYTLVGYTFLEYIKTTGTQYIDTGFKPNQDTKIEIDFMYHTRQLKNTLYFGATATWSNATFGFYGSSTAGSFYSNYNDDINVTNYVCPSLDVRYKYVQDKNKIYLDNALVYTHKTATFQSKNNLFLFVNRLDSSGYVGYVTFYNGKLWDNGTLIRDFVPVMRGGDNAIGLYDTISGQFFENAGTGEFIPGPEVE